MTLITFVEQLLFCVNMGDIKEFLKPLLGIYKLIVKFSLS